MRGLRLVFAIAALLLASCASNEAQSGSTGTIVTSAESSTLSGAASSTTTTSPTATTTLSTTTTTSSTTTTTTLPPFTELDLSGNGDDVVDVSVPGGQPAIVIFTYHGGGNFSVWSYDANGDRIDLLVNTIGAYEGTRPINFLVGEDVAMFEVGANAAWTAVVKPLADAPRIPTSGTYQGTGDAVLIDPSAPSSASRGTFTHSGESNFAIWAWGTSRDLLVNEIGPYQGTVVVPAGTIVYDITADGAWTVALDR